jgi:hypothetical protein
LAFDFLTKHLTHNEEILFDKIVLNAKIGKWFIKILKQNLKKIKKIPYRVVNINKYKKTSEYKNIIINIYVIVKIIANVKKKCKCNKVCKCNIDYDSNLEIQN